MLQCELCLEEKPVAEFSRFENGLICKSCMTGRNTKKLDSALKEKAKHIAGQLAEMSPGDLGGGVGKVRTILSDVYAQFGGTTAYAAHLHYVIMKLTEQNPMPASVGHIMLNIMKLHHTVEQTEETITAREMSDEQLKREHQLTMMRIATEAMDDPEKRKVLELMLSKKGLAITEADPHESIALSAEILDSEELES